MVKTKASKAYGLPLNLHFQQSNDKINILPYWIISFEKDLWYGTVRHQEIEAKVQQSKRQEGSKRVTVKSRREF